jgi:hypothetical protein
MKTILVISNNDLFKKQLVQNKRHKYLFCDVKNLTALYYDMHNVDSIIITIFPSDFIDKEVAYLYNILFTKTLVSKNLLFVLNNKNYTDNILKYENRHLFKNLLEILQEDKNIRFYLNDVDYFINEILK